MRKKALWEEANGGSVPDTIENRDELVHHMLDMQRHYQHVAKRDRPATFYLCMHNDRLGYMRSNDAKLTSFIIAMWSPDKLFTMVNEQPGRVTWYNTL